MDWAVLTELPEAERRSLLSRAWRRRYAKGEVVFHEGDPGASLHLINKGRAAVRLTTTLGDIHILRVIPPGGWFGELALIAPATRSATVVALEPLETLAMNRDDLDEIRQRFPTFDRVLSESLAIEVRLLSAALLEALFIPVEQRTYRRLAELIPLYANGAMPIVIPLTQQEVAQLVGTTRPTVNKVLQAASAAGILTVRRGHIEIREPDVLTRRGR